MQTIQNKNGSKRIYLHLVESRRVNGKVKQKFICTLGRLDVLQKSGALKRIISSLSHYSKPKSFETESPMILSRYNLEYGPVLVFWKLWQHLGLHQLFRDLYKSNTVESPIEKAMFGMVLNHILIPSTKLGMYEWIKEGVYCSEFKKLELHHLYQALDFLAKHIMIMEEKLFLEDREVFNKDIYILFFNNTNFHFDNSGTQQLAELGHGRKKHSNQQEMIIGLMMTHDGIPVTHYLFAGNIVNIASFKYVMSDLQRRFAIHKVKVVADRAVVSENLFETLEKEEIGYISIKPLKKWRAADRVLTRTGLYHKLDNNLRIKEVWDNKQRYVVCHNRELAPEEARRRAEKAAYLETKLPGVNKERHASPVNIIRNGKSIEVDLERFKKDERFDGKFLLQSNTNLPAAEIALAYKKLWRAKEAFQKMRTESEIREMHLWTPSMVRGNFSIYFLALFLESSLAKLLKERGSEVSYRDVLKDLQKLKVVHLEINSKSFLLRTELNGQAYKAFKAVGLRPPPRLQQLSEKEEPSTFSL